MKKLTRKFKEGFRSYDYNEQDIDILLALFDIVLEMMNIVNMEDHGNIKKLSSFIQLLSTGYSNSIIDAILIEEIYDTTIIPVLDSFDNKYTSKFMAITTKEIVNGIPHVAVITDKESLELSEEYHSKITNINETKKILGTILENNGNKVSDEKIVQCSSYNDSDDEYIDEYSNEEILMLNKFILENRDTDDPEIYETMFNMIKDISSTLHRIYDSFTSGKSQEHIEDYIHDLILIKNTMDLVDKIDDTSIHILADVVQSVCYSLIDELNKNQILPPSSVMLIELKFKSLEGVKYHQRV